MSIVPKPSSMAIKKVPAKRNTYRLTSKQNSVKETKVEDQAKTITNYSPEEKTFLQESRAMGMKFDAIASDLNKKFHGGEAVRSPIGVQAYFYGLNKRKKPEPEISTQSLLTMWHGTREMLSRGYLDEATAKVIREKIISNLSIEESRKLLLEMA